MVCHFNATYIPGSTHKKFMFQQNQNYGQSIERRIECQQISQDCFHIWVSIYSTNYSTHSIVDVELSAGENIKSEPPLIFKDKIKGIAEKEGDASYTG